MRLLFAHRAVFHRIAASALPSDSAPSTVVCWVDALLAKLAPFIAGDRAAEPQNEFLQSQRYSDSLRAAAQLPKSWDDLTYALTSSAMSPAARRLAVRLLFGVYVLAQDPIDNGEVAAPSSDLLAAVSAFLEHVQIDRAIDAQPGIIALQERTTCAMTFALYATADSCTIEDNNPFMRPRSLGRLLDLARAVMHPGANESISQVLDPPMKVLLGAPILLWCWRTWWDHRIASIEIVSNMTTAWLRHVMQAEDIATYHMEKQAEACCTAMLHVLYYASPHIRSDVPDLLDVTHKALLVINHLCRERGLFPAQTSDMCSVALRVLVVLKDGEEGLRVKDAIIELLALADEDVLRAALEVARDDVKLRFPNSIDEAVGRARRLLPPTNAPFPTNFTTLHPIMTTLHLLALIWHSEARGCIIRYPAAHLLSMLVEHLASAPLSAPPVLGLIDATYTALAAAECAEAREETANTMAWVIGARVGREAIGVAGSFSHYILAATRFPAPLACIEAADALRDALLLIMRQHFVGDEEPLALLVAPTVCAALMRLMNSSAAVAHFMLSSPWTISLAQELQRVLDGALADEYTVLLQDRVNISGKVLLDLFHSKVEGILVASDVPSRRSKLLVYHTSTNSSRLICIDAA
ncbi:hypothetical protein BD626DRAFT_485704 [Schizophyllum amplum]|uniref:Uncharacterized protein n=1 Tax=Schizophyllum amplum TaxID=97359 RepID=A0A550CLR1_9AGAR|nr:hypothetical protein BD626DRAFT_485704 [Auriculariopsis ampla]